MLYVKGFICLGYSSNAQSNLEFFFSPFHSVGQWVGLWNPNLNFMTLIAVFPLCLIQVHKE